MAKQTRRHKSDGFAVTVTPRSKLGGVPGVVVVERRKNRPHGTVGLGRELLRTVLPEPPTRQAMDALARQIGQEILKSSGHARRWSRSRRKASKP